MCQCGALYVAIGVLSSLGGPGGTGRIGSGRTLSWPGDETDPSSTECVRGEFGVTRTSGEPDVSRRGGATGIIRSGNVGRTLVDGVRGGDHAGGGDLGRDWPASTGS